MNSLERVMAAVTGADADRQPFTMLLSLYGASLLRCDINEYYRNSSLWFEGQKAIVDTFDPDILITPFSFSLEAEAYGSETVFLEQYAPNVKKPIINNLSEIGTIKIPDIYKSPSIQFFLQSTRLLADVYKENKAIAAVLHSPCDLPSLLIGIEMWIDTLLFHPNAVEEVLEKTTEHFVNLGNEYIAQGATFLVVPVNFTNPMIITNKIFSRLLPHLENAFSQIKGPIVIHNGGCVLKPFLAQFSKLPNVIAVVPDSSEKLDEAREIVGEKMVLMGNFDGPDFINLSPGKAKEVCLKILDNRKHDKHYIFATSNADIPYNTPVETIKAVVDAIKNYQKY